MLTQNWQLSKRLRAPAISRLQKIHNVEIAFKELTGQGVELEGLRGGRVSPKDIVDGHREKTLGMLWRLIFKFQVSFLMRKIINPVFSTERRMYSFLHNEI
jgi:abnormal spindle-like microcephaly-associated protein